MSKSSVSPAWGCPTGYASKHKRPGKLCLNSGFDFCAGATKATSRRPRVMDSSRCSVTPLPTKTTSTVRSGLGITREVRRLSEQR